MSKKESTSIDDLLNSLSAQHKPGTYIFKNVNLLTMLDSLLAERDVLIENGLIKEIGSNISDPLAVEIDGTGKYLMPGLTDMHVHLFEHHQLKNTWMLLLLVNGVTSVRDMAGEPGKLALRESIRNNNVLGPSIYQAGPILNGPGNQPVTVLASTPDEGQGYVKEQKDAGYDFIKVYNDLNRETYFAILEEAQKQAIQVIGHVPTEVKIAEVLNNQRSIEHLTGYRDWKDNVEAYVIADQDYASATANSDTWNCPTLYNLLINWDKDLALNVMDDQSISNVLPNRLKNRWADLMAKNAQNKEELLEKYGAANSALFNGIVEALYNASAKLVAGTDAGSIPLLVPGFSLHQELIALNQIGITVYDVLKMATVNPARCMDREKEFGTIEVGKRADLLLLNSNPLEDIRNLNNKAGVMVRGIWLSNDELEKISIEIQHAFGNEIK